MITVGKVFGFIIILYMAAFFSGSFFACSGKEKRHLVPYAVVYGFLVIFAGFSVIFSVCTALSVSLFHAVCLWGAFCIVFSAVGAVKYRKERKELSLSNGIRFGKEKAVLFILATAQILCSSIFRKTDFEGIQALVPAVKSFEQGIPAAQGELFPLWFSAVGTLLHISPSALAIGFSGLMFLPVCYMAFFLLGERLFAREKTEGTLFAVGCGLFLWIGSASDMTFSLYRSQTMAGAFLLPVLLFVLCGMNRKNAKNRIGLTVLILVAGVMFGIWCLFAVLLTMLAFVLVKILPKPCAKFISGIRARTSAQNKERSSFEEGEDEMNGKTKKLILTAGLLMIPVLLAFVFCIYKLNNKINSVYLITRQIIAEMKEDSSQEQYVTQEKIDEIISDKVDSLTGDKPKDFTISRFTEADGMSFITCDTGSEETYRLYQIDMNEDAGGLGYVLKLPEGGLVVFDGGYEGDGPKIHDFIVQHGGVVNAWILTHPHYDHIGAFLYCMTEASEDIEVQSVYYSPFTKEFFEEGRYKEDELEYEALRFDEFEEIRQKAKDISFVPVSRGDRIQIENLMMECLSGFLPEVRDVNENSLVLRVEMNGVSMLVTGDITEKTVDRMVSFLGEENEKWDVDFLQIPHHGYIGTGDRLYELTRPRFTLLDCSTKEYQDDTLKIRSGTVDGLHEMGVGIVKRFEGTNVIVIQ